MKSLRNKKINKHNKTLKKHKHQKVIDYPQTIEYKHTNKSLESVAKMVNKSMGYKVLEPKKFIRDFKTKMNSYFSQNQNLKEMYEELKKTNKSNGHKLFWQFSHINAPWMHKLHMHPNIEFVYIVDGKWSELRLDEPLQAPNDILETKENQWATKHYDSKNDSTNYFINYKDTVHTDFNDTNNKVAILLLWSGNEYNFKPHQYPNFVKKYVREHGFTV